MRTLSFAALASLVLACGPALAAHKADCSRSAVEKLRASAPDGYAVYQQIKDKKFFFTWITCDDAQFGLPTAVHESVHYLTADNDSFPLVDGGEIARPHEVSQFFAPSRIAGRFKPDDFVATYLRPGRASSSSDFLYLLDELNAYTHDLNAAVDLKNLRREDEYTDNRDGLAALMAFVAVYVERAEASEPSTWSGLQKPEVAKTLTALWDRAEKVMQSSCGLPDFGTEDKALIRRFCQPSAQASLQTIIGRAPVCPTECLTAPLDATTESEEQATDRVSPDPAARTIWSRRVNRRGSPSENSDADERATTE